MGQSLEQLLQGYVKFKNNYGSGADSMMSHLASHGQKPKVMVIACSDSRVDPAVLLQCDPGDLFVVRNVSNLVAPYQAKSVDATAAAMEYAVCYLGIESLVILGHSECGGLGALMNPSSLHQDDCISSWVSHSGLSSVLDTATDVNDLCFKSLHRSAEHCMTYPWIRQRVNAGELAIHRWFLNLPTASLLTFDQSQNRFIPVSGA